MQPTTVQVWLEWTLATLVGYVVGIPFVLFISLSIYYSPSIDQATKPPFLIGLIGGAELGATIGIAQWLVLRRHTTIGWFWVGASIVGGALGLAPGMFVSESIAPAIVVAYRFPEPWGAVWQYSPMWALFGLGLGMAQWWVLRRHARFVGWWIAANVIGWMVGQGALAPVAGLLPALVGILGGDLAPGLIAGGITGSVLVDSEAR